MKNELLRIVFVSSLAIGALAITTTAQAQQTGGQTGSASNGSNSGSNAENSGGGHNATHLRRRWRGSPNNPRRRRAKAYIPAGECECTIRKASRNSNAATYRICKMRVQLNDGSLMTRSCQPTG